MIITQKTRLRDMLKIYPLLQCSDVDLMKECAKHKFSGAIRGIKPKPFDDVTMREQVWLWDVKDSREQLNAICEIFFKRDPEKWLMKCYLIDFYAFVNQVVERSVYHANLFSNLKVDLTEEEKKAGYGEGTKSGVKSMVLEMSELRQISIDEAWDLKVIEYYLVFEHRIENINRQRKLQEIYNQKHN